MVGEAIGDGNRLAAAAQDTIKQADAAIASLSDSVRAIRETNTSIASAAEQQNLIAWQTKVGSHYHEGLFSSWHVIGRHGTPAGE